MGVQMGGAMGVWVDGWVGGWMDGRSIVRAFSLLSISTSFFSFLSSTDIRLRTPRSFVGATEDHQWLQGLDS